jgi:hypothetical protein
MEDSQEQQVLAFHSAGDDRVAEIFCGKVDEGVGLGVRDPG